MKLPLHLLLEFFLIWTAILIIPQSCFTQNLITTDKSMDPGQIVNSPGFPSIGKWMLDEHFKLASWLKHKYLKKVMHEPINIILIDSISKSPEETITHLIDDCRSAGFTIKLGHSAEYIGYIGGNFYSQIPEGAGKAFSDTRYTKNNNHGRIFGPYLFNGKYYFTASLSREDFVRNRHVYDSFIKARDDFAQKMDKNSDYKITGKLNLENAVPVNDPVLTTGDHDGMAIILETK